MGNAAAYGARFKASAAVDASRGCGDVVSIACVGHATQMVRVQSPALEPLLDPDYGDAEAEAVEPIRERKQPRGRGPKRVRLVLASTVIADFRKSRRG